MRLRYILATMGVVLASLPAQSQQVSRQKVPLVGKQTIYSHVGGDPRRGPIASFEDALRIASRDQKVRNDLDNWLIKGFPKSCWGIYRDCLIPAFYARIQAAVAVRDHSHNGDGICSRCGKPNELVRRLASEVTRAAIPLDTVYAAVSHGKNGGVQLNRKFHPKNGVTYYALDVELNGVICKEFENDRRRTQVMADTFFHLILRCGNTAAGPLVLTSITQEKIENVRTREVPVIEREAPYREVEAAGYREAAPTTIEKFQYSAVSIGIQPVEKHKRAQQIVILKDLVDIINNNININQNENNNAIGVAAGGGK